MLGFSFGGGVQSWAIVCLVHQGRLPVPDLTVFANTGGEDPETLLYLKRHRALLDAINFVDVRPGTFDAGPQWGLYQDIMRTGKLRIPAAFDGGGRANRTCTNEYKVRQVRRAMRHHQKCAWTMWLGFSWDEVTRMKTSDRKWLSHEYPLIDLCLDRAACETVIADFGLDVPPPSRCFFCPYKRPEDWAVDKKDRPAIFQAALTVEQRLNQSRAQAGKDPIQIINLAADDALCGSSCWT